MTMIESIAVLVGVASGISGLVLGILNYRHRLDVTRPRLTVRPCVYAIVDRSTGQTERNVGVFQICNIGHVPVVPSGIGFKPKNKGSKGHLIVTPESINGQELAEELKPGHVAMLRFDLSNLPDAAEIGRAQVWTVTGESYTASNRDMKKFAKDRVKKRS